MKQGCQSKQSWRFIQSPAQDAATNMAIDEAILTMHSQNKVPPTIRFYSWSPASLTLGYFQRAEKEIFFPAVKKYGLDFVRRPTGGRAVLHEQELTYSVIMKENLLQKTATITESYRSLSLGLLHGFRLLGLNAYFAIPEGKIPTQNRSAVCFDAPSWYELVVEGRKVAGSAQIRREGTILQHGSILLDIDVDLLFELFNYTDEERKAQAKQTFKEKAVAINQLIGKSITLSQAEEAFRQGFIEGLEIDLDEGELSTEEKELAKELAATKYSRDEWNFKR